MDIDTELSRIEDRLTNVERLLVALEEQTLQQILDLQTELHILQESITS